MMRMELIEPVRAREYFQRIEPELYRYPAVDPRSFQQTVEEVFGASA